MTNPRLHLAYAAPGPETMTIQAQTLWQRLAAAAAGESGTVDVDLLEMWRERVAESKAHIFSRRLKLANVNGDVETHLPTEARKRPLFDIGLPLTRPDPAQLEGDPRSIDARRGELLGKITRTIAGPRPEAFLGSLPTTPSCSPAARESARSALYKRIMLITSQLLVHEFTRYKIRTSSGSLSRDPRLLSEEKQELLGLEFLTSLSTLPLSTIRTLYPVWSRLCDLDSERWITHTQLLFERLEGDREIISKEFGIAPEDGLVSLTSGGDTHRGGKSVHILTFESGARLVYKPRSVCVDTWYRELLLWISRQPGISLPLDAPKVIDKKEYGWCSFIEHKTVDSDELEERFYQRMGMLLCIWSLFGGNDGHYENVIAHGEFPHVVDTETLFDGHGPMNRRGRGWTVAHECMERIAYSVKRVGFLPRYLQPNEHVKPFDLSALGLRSPIPAPFFSEDETQKASRYLGLSRSGSVELLPQGNVPRERSGPLGPRLISAIERGFAEVYDVVAANKRSLIRKIRALARNPQARARIVVRPTHLFSRLLTESLTPACLRDGSKRSIEIDRLSIKYTGTNPSRFDGEMLAAEIEAIENLDIPLFDVPLSSPARTSESCSRLGELSRRRIGSPAQTAITQVQNSCEERKTFELRLIRESFILDDKLRVSQDRPDSHIVEHTAPTLRPNSADVWSRIEEIERLITSSACVAPDGGLGWIAPSALTDGDHFEHISLGPSLYAGSSGVALFYAALYRTTGNPAHRQAALDSLKPLYQAIHRAVRGPVQLSTALLRDIYPVLLCSQFLADASLLQPLHNLLERVSKRALEQDTGLDVILGSAGTILNLLAFLRATGDQRAVQLASIAGEHLIAHRIETTSGLRAWKTLDAALGGFAHGVAGISLSLERLGVETANSRYLDASLEALAYERTLYSPQHRNWADLRHTSKGEPASYSAAAWCHGAPGIGMAYLCISDLRSDPNLEESISLARETAAIHSTSASDTVCCGAFGRAAFFDRLARKRGDSEAAALRDGILADFVKRGPLQSRLVEDIPAYFESPGFFNGLSGLGYELLRHFFDTELPPVMLWE